MLKEFSFGLIVILSLIGSIPIQYGWESTGIAATVIRFLSTGAQRQAAPCNVGQGAVKNQLAMPESSCGSIEARQKQVFAPGSLPSELGDQQENAGTNRLAASEGTAGQRTAMPRMPENFAIRYVSNVGSDANDGLSWGTAKHTIYGALVSLPGGGTNKAGSGTVYVGPGSTANPTSGAGIWLMGPNDPNYASPPVGWLKGAGGSTAINIIGIGNATTGPNGHIPRVIVSAGSGADVHHPSLWLSAWNSSTYIANLHFQYPGRAVVIGECSTGTRTNTCQSTAITLDNVAGFANSSIRTNGPCTDITGSSFWIFLRDYGCTGLGYGAAGGIRANNAAAILIDGTGNTGNGVEIVNGNLGGGGIKEIPGSNGFALYASSVIEEGDFNHPIPPTVWITDFFTGCDARLDEITQSDAGAGSMPTIQNDANFADGSGNHGSVAGPTVFNSAGAPQGQATVINPTYAGSQTVDPLVYGSSGFFNKYMVGQTNVARRIGGLTPTRFINKADTNTANWTNTNLAGVQTITRGLTDPFGGMGAASPSSTAAKNEYIQMGSCFAYTPAVGDWIVIGVWEHGVVSSNDLFVGGCVGSAFPTMSKTIRNRGMIYGDGNWEFIWTAYKVASGPATQMGVAEIFSNKFLPTLYGPLLYVVPAGTISDNEVIEFASTMNSVDPNCRVGQICNVAGHPLVVSSYGTMSNCRSAVSPAKCDSAPAGSFVLGVGSTTAKVNTTAVTPDSQILIIEDSSLGAKLGVSCNKTTGRTYMITDRAPGFSFTVSSSFAPTDLPACLSFQLLN